MKEREGGPNLPTLPSLAGFHGANSGTITTLSSVKAPLLTEVVWEVKATSLWSQRSSKKRIVL